MLLLRSAAHQLLLRPGTGCSSAAAAAAAGRCGWQAAAAVVHAKPGPVGQPRHIGSARASHPLFVRSPFAAAGMSSTSSAAAAAAGSTPDAATGAAAAAAATAPIAPASAPQVSRIAVGQMTAGGDQEANLATCTRLAQEAAAAGACMLFLPECFSFIGSSQPESLAAAQPLDGPLMARYQELARSTGLWLSLGGFQEVGPDKDHIYNTHVVLSSTGERVALYRKIHLFDVDVPSGPVLMESRTTAPGDRLVACGTPAGHLGLTICYDLRFPEQFQKLTWGLGAQLLAVPAAFTKPTGEAHWEVLLRARAIECQAYVVAAAQAGKHNHKRESFGHSLIIDPWGKVVGRLQDPLATGIAVADVDLGRVAEVRAKMPIAAHRAKGHAAYFP